MEGFDSHEAVLRIRSTFLDFGRDAMKLQLRRSASAPQSSSPKPLVIFDEQARYVDSLVKRTLSLRLSQLQKKSKADQRAGQQEKPVCVCSRSDSIETSSSVAPSPHESLAGVSTTSSFASWEDDSSLLIGSNNHAPRSTRKRGRGVRSAKEKPQEERRASQLPQLTAAKQIGVQQQSLRCLALQRCDAEDAVSGDPVQDAEPITTVMICDIPCSKSIEHVLEVVNSFGFEGEYDFAYMPSRRKAPAKENCGNLGYTFINFKNPVSAESFMEVFQNIVFPASLTKKLSYARAACHQGYEANVGMHMSRGRRPGTMVKFP